MCPSSSWFRSTIPHGAIPMLTTRPDRCCPSSSRASPTCFVTPVNWTDRSAANVFLLVLLNDIVAVVGMVQHVASTACAVNEEVILQKFLIRDSFTGDGHLQRCRLNWRKLVSKCTPLAAEVVEGTNRREHYSVLIGL